MGGRERGKLLNYNKLATQTLACERKASCEGRGHFVLGWRARNKGDWVIINLRLVVNLPLR